MERNPKFSTMLYKANNNEKKISSPKAFYLQGHYSSTHWYTVMDGWMDDKWSEKQFSVESQFLSQPCWFTRPSNFSLKK
jgi:hypothetical protein